MLGRAVKRALKGVREDSIEKQSVQAEDAHTKRTYSTQRRTQPTIGTPVHPLNSYTGWSAGSGNISETTEESFYGTTSLKMTDNSGSTVRATYSFSNNRDFRNKGIYAPVYWAKPKDAAAFRMLIQDGSGNRLWANASAKSNTTGSADGWMIAEFAINEEIDNTKVDLSDVTEIHYYFGNGINADTLIYAEAPILVDYGRTRGGVLLTVDDGDETWISEMLPKLDKYGWSALLFTMSSKLEDGTLSESDLQTLYERGCWIGAHPQRDQSLTEMALSDAEQAIGEEYQFVSERFGDDPARMMSWPYGDSGPDVEEPARDVFDMCFKGAADRGVAAWRSGAMMEVPRTTFGSLSDLTTALDLAEKYNRVCIPQFHNFNSGGSTGGTNITPTDFEAFLDDVESRDLEVLTPDQFFQYRTSPPQITRQDRGTVAGAIDLNTSGVQSTTINYALPSTPDPEDFSIYLANAGASDFAATWNINSIGAASATVDVNVTSTSATSGVSADLSWNVEL